MLTLLTKVVLSNTCHWFNLELKFLNEIKEKIQYNLEKFIEKLSPHENNVELIESFKKKETERQYLLKVAFLVYQKKNAIKRQ